MPVCSVILLSLSVPVPQFLSALSTSSTTPLTVGRVVRWIILPNSTSTDKLLAQNIHWDLLLTLPDSEPLSSDLQRLVRHQWIVHAGVPSRLLQNFEAKNGDLLHPKAGEVPELTGSLTKPRTASSSQDLELSPELKEWVYTFGKQEGRGAVSMLNLLAFKEGMKAEYLKYGAEFAKSVGSRRGGTAKIVGTVVRKDGDGGEGWDEVALAHYPSIWHFADMLASEDYQAVNRKYRVGSLRDTFILCTTEVDAEVEAAKHQAKL
ncbi:hypothetical protein V495_02486 [Pseudogymnoascus sp. VKM F-4514 (FW-929)]|nr:hypothetical protein V495_02486 [Pseudogymnoascus sp. VKM F-4514 (FW-929)]KFY54056.1 hypothetical protein V497_08003 [Pseudogymnoascus sp. VKM F-4516 (FW-969)]